MGYLEKIMDMGSNLNYMHCCVGFAAVEFAWNFYLVYRQRRTAKENRTPNEDIKAIMDGESFTRARLYSLEKINFGMVQSFFNEVLSSTTTLLFFTSFLWNISGKTLQYFGYSGELIQSNVFIVYSSLFASIVAIPWSLYSHFVVEERHGFNKMTLGFFVKDTIKKSVLGLLLQSALMTPLICLIKWGGDKFFIYAWGFTFVFTIAFFFIYMDFIAPLFDKYTPLPESPLRTAIENLAKSVSFPLTKLYVVDGSKRSSHSNAFFYGFMKNKRIVLFDTLLDDSCNPMLGLDEDGNKKEFPSEEDTEPEEAGQKKKKKGCTEEEVIAVLGHELGHWYHGHVYKPLIFNQFIVLGMFYMFGVLVKNNKMLADFGFVDEQPTLIALGIIFNNIFSPLNTVIQYSMTYLTRCNEFQADRYAVSLGKGSKLQSSLAKLVNDNLSFPIADRLYSMFNYSHPPILERLAAIRAEMDKKKIE